MMKVVGKDRTLRVVLRTKQMKCMVAPEWLHLNQILQGDESARREEEGYASKGLQLRGAFPL